MHRKPKKKSKSVDEQLSQESACSLDFILVFFDFANTQFFVFYSIERLVTYAIASIFQSLCCQLRLKNKYANSIF